MGEKYGMETSGTKVDHEVWRLRYIGCLIYAEDMLLVDHFPHTDAFWHLYKRRLVNTEITLIILSFLEICHMFGKVLSRSSAVNLLRVGKD